MVVSNQRDRIFSFFLGQFEAGRVYLFCLRVLDLFILVEMVLPE